GAEGEALRAALTPGGVVGAGEVERGVDNVQRNAGAAGEIGFVGRVFGVEVGEGIGAAEDVGGAEEGAHQPHAVHAVQREEVDVDGEVDQHGEGDGDGEDDEAAAQAAGG